MLAIAIGWLAITTIVTQGSVIKSPSFELEGRIVGGNDTAIENFPYMVSVRAHGHHYCGGNIISKRVILTAAHCIHSYIPTTSYSIQYGVSVIGDNKNVITAKRVLQNEKFDYSNFNNDVALIFLVSDIPFSAAAQPIQLATIAPAIGVAANITGWGALAENGVNARTLQQVSVQIMDKSICQEQYKRTITITEVMLCAGVSGGGKDACQDDSGGPLVSNKTLVGIVSFGMGCARANYFGVYSNVAALKNWIDLNMTE